MGGASTAYRFPKGIDIEIDILKKHRRKGLATAAGAKLILDCLERGWRPTWDAANMKSVHLSEKLGYTFNYKYHCFWISPIFFKTIKNPDKSKWESYCGKYETNCKDFKLKEVWMKDGDLYGRADNEVRRNIKFKFYPIGLNVFGRRDGNAIVTFEKDSYIINDIVCKKIYNIALKADFPDAKGFSPRNLARMRKFYETYRDLSILPTALAKLPWSFNCLLIDRVNDSEKRAWYAEKCLENGWSFVLLDHQIDLNLYQRQSDNSAKLTNFGEHLPAVQGELAQDLIKDPYIFELSGLTERSAKRDIEKAMVERIKTVLLEFGQGFSFVGNQYRISTEGKDYYLDLLFYHIKLRCYVALELKNTDFDPSFIGQLSFYVKAVDKTLKEDSNAPTIGLLLCRNKDKDSVEWSLETTTSPIGVASYEIRQYLPSQEQINDFLK